MMNMSLLQFKGWSLIASALGLVAGKHDAPSTPFGDGTKISWTHRDGTRHYADVPKDGVLLSTILTATKADIQSVDVIPSSVACIGEYAFSGCYGLRDVTMPLSVRRIGEYAFSGCYGLKGVAIPNGVTSIGGGAFSGCYGLRGVAIPNGVTSIECGAFSGCCGLRSVTIPSGVTSIGSTAFYGCAGLRSVTIPSSVEHIGSNAFAGCAKCARVRVEAVIPPRMSAPEPFSAAALQCIQVPAISVDAYKASRGWNAYADRILGY